ncbi:MAG: helix-turn-helix domain-containing protein, partial [Bacteroidota bacterium]
FNARIIIARSAEHDMNRLEDELQKGLFRRLTPIIVTLPPLRERRDDILPLVNNFIKMSNERNGTDVTGMSPEALKIFLKYSWPGNIRELQNTVEYGVIMAQDHLLLPVHLPLQVRAGRLPPRKEIIGRRDLSVLDVEKRMIDQALRRTASKKEAARLLGISVKNLYDKLQRNSLSNKPVHNEKNMPDKEEQLADNIREHFHHVVNS